MKWYLTVCLVSVSLFRQCIATVVTLFSGNSPPSAVADKVTDESPNLLIDHIILAPFKPVQIVNLITHYGYTLRDYSRFSGTRMI